MSKPKFELICKSDGGTNRVLVMKNVSSTIVSNIQVESFELIYHDGNGENLLPYDNIFPTSLGPNETKEVSCLNPTLTHRGVGFNTIRLIFTAEDERSNKYKCVSTKNVEDKRFYLLGPWDTKVEYVDNGESRSEISNYLNMDINLPHEFISACAKIADNPASYASFDEDSLNREVRNFLDSAITRFGYIIADQTQQGVGVTNKKAGELDIRISKNGIPVAIYEGLVHKDKDWPEKHIEKAIGRYNQSGCKEVYVVEFSRNKRFGEFWDIACETLEEHGDVNVSEVNTGLLGVRMLKGNYDWEGQKGNLYYIGVNCNPKLKTT